MDRSHLLVAFLLGVCVALGTALVLKSGTALPQAQAQSAGGGTGGMFAVTGTGTEGQGQDVLFVIDPSSTRLAVYNYKGGRLTLGAIRNIEYDLRFQEWSMPGKQQAPGVHDMKNASERGSRRHR